MDAPAHLRFPSAAKSPFRVTSTRNPEQFSPRYIRILCSGLLFSTCPWQHGSWRGSSQLAARRSALRWPKHPPILCILGAPPAMEPSRGESRIEYSWGLDRRSRQTIQNRPALQNYPELIEQYHSEEYVFWFDVAMHEMVFVHGGHCRAQLPNHLWHLVNIQLYIKLLFLL